LKTNIRQQNGVHILDVIGRIDSSVAPKLEEELNNLISQGVIKIIVNFKEVSYISSGGLRVLLAVIKQLKTKNGDLKLYGMKPNIYKIFKLVGFTSIFKIYESEEEAVLAFYYRSN